MNDGGHDAPMGATDSMLFKGICAAVVILALAIILIALFD